MTEAKKRGRPAIEAPWCEAAAKLVAYGCPLPRALVRLGVFGLSRRDIKNLYRHVRFRHYHEMYRRQFFNEWGSGSERLQGRDDLERYLEV